MFSYTVRGRIDGIFGMQVILGDDPVVGYYVRRPGADPIRRLNFLVMRDKKFVVGRMKIAALTDFTSGTFTHAAGASGSKPVSYPGLVGLTSAGKVFRLDLSNLAAGKLPGAESEQAASALAAAARQKNIRLLKGVSVVNLSRNR